MAPTWESGVNADVEEGEKDTPETFLLLDVREGNPFYLLFYYGNESVGA